MLAYMGLIVVFSSMSSPPAPDPRVLKPDKLWHFLEYAVLGLLCFRAFANTPNLGLSRHPYLLMIAVVAVFGATDELHQYFVPGREASPFDWMADVGGGIIAAAGVRIVKGRKGEVKG